MASARPATRPATGSGEPREPGAAAHAAGATPDRVPRRARSARPALLRTLWALPPVAALGLFFLYPLALVVRQSFTPDTGPRSAHAYRQVLGEHSFRSAVWNTVWIAAASTAGCLVLGFGLALVVAFVPFPGAKVLGRFIDVFLAFPSFLITLALLFVYGSAGLANGAWTDLTGAASGPVDFLRTPWGVLLAEVTYFTPFVMRPLLAAFSQVEPAQLEAAASLGARAPRIVRQVILPESLAALAAGGGLVLVLCLNEFGIVLFTGAKGVTTLPLLVYSKAILDGDYPGACVVAVASVLLSAACYGLYRAAMARALGGGRRAGA
ncbi:2-aminoethylphosphonate ABC transporter permease subunit [Streptomyces sp. V4-01]|uniref:2-aminoethylphosphonate ABC transporter permease subunit n=1 Tax=Actinacidiphila polyblastidii TaxID=3110430 RepID=A0ABU7PLX5_9ACTN|nr:2-aminoethylphosphonate ABC transporter permease subunit [Streptomyces sp. V4-01]